MITYYFGAGASALALPVVDRMPSEMLMMATNSKASHLFKDASGGIVIPKAELMITADNPVSEIEIWEDFSRNLLWLNEEGRNHTSIDTFAKKLFVRKDFSSLKKLKATLSTFFTLCQVQNFDKRYDAFFATLIDEDPFSLPSNIRIISWNYDWQFEKAYSEYSDLKSLNDLQRKLNVISKFFDGKNDPIKFSLTKINGSVGFYSPIKSPFNYVNVLPSNDFEIESKKVLKTYADFLFEKGNDWESTLSFSWEPEQEKGNIINAAKENIHDCEVLVIIGYSFPNFNRRVDREIIGSIKNLKKIYIQTLKESAENVKIRFKAILPDFPDNRIILWTDCDQFLIPDEY